MDTNDYRQNNNLQTEPPAHTPQNYNEGNASHNEPLQTAAGSSHSSASAPSGEYHYGSGQVSNDYNIYQSPNIPAAQADNPSSHSLANNPQAQAPAYAPHSAVANAGQYPKTNYTQNYAPSYYSPFNENTNEQNGKSKKEKRQRISVFSLVAIMIVAIFAGFGGGALAFELLGMGEPSVIYQAPENNNSQNDANSTSGLSQTDFSEVAEFAGPSVVSIITSSYSGGLFPSQGAGSGVIITEDGYIITNHHVIDGASRVTVILDSGEEYSATVIGSDKNSDIGVVKINVSGLKPAIIGNSDDLRVGEFCLAIGNPMGNLGGTVTFGMISALSREITIDNISMTLLQMSAPVSPGNSGGGLFDSSGNLIGIVNAKSGGSDSEGLGFAIPVNKALGIFEDILKYGKVSRASLGVYIRTYTIDDEALVDGYEKAGIYIVQINPGSAAEAAGLQPRDRIVKFNGSAITRSSSLTSEIEKMKVGDEVEMVVERNGEMLTFNIVLMEAEDVPLMPENGGQ